MTDALTSQFARLKCEANQSNLTNHYALLLKDAFKEANSAYTAILSKGTSIDVELAAQLYQSFGVFLASWFTLSKLLLDKDVEEQSEDDLFLSLWLLSDRARVPIVRAFRAAETAALLATKVKLSHEDGNAPDVERVRTELSESISKRVKGSVPADESLGLAIEDALKMVGNPTNSDNSEALILSWPRWKQVVGQSHVRLESDQTDADHASVDEKSSIFIDSHEGKDDEGGNPESSQQDEALDVLAKFFSGDTAKLVEPDIAFPINDLGVSKRLLAKIVQLNSKRENTSELSKLSHSLAVSPSYFAAFVNMILKQTSIEELPVFTKELGDLCELLLTSTFAATYFPVVATIVKSLQSAFVRTLAQANADAKKGFALHTSQALARIAKAFSTQVTSGCLENSALLQVTDKESKSVHSMTEMSKTISNLPIFSISEKSEYQMLQQSQASELLIVMQITSFLSLLSQQDEDVELGKVLESVTLIIRKWLSCTSTFSKTENKAQKEHLERRITCACVASLNLLTKCDETEENRHCIPSTLVRVFTPSVLGQLIVTGSFPFHQWLGPCMSLIQALLSWVLDLPEAQSSDCELRAEYKNESKVDAETKDESSGEEQDDVESSGDPWWQGWRISLARALLDTANIESLNDMNWENGIALFATITLIRPMYATKLLTNLTFSDAESPSEDSKTLPPLLTLLDALVCNKLPFEGNQGEIWAQLASLILSISAPRDPIVLSLICPLQSKNDDGGESSLNLNSRPHPVFDSIVKVASDSRLSDTPSHWAFSPVARIASASAIAICQSNPSSFFDLASKYSSSVVSAIVDTSVLVKNIISCQNLDERGISTLEYAQCIVSDLVRLSSETLAFASTHIHFKEMLTMPLNDAVEPDTCSSKANDECSALQHFLLLLPGQPEKTVESSLRPTYCPRYPFSDVSATSVSKYWEELFLADLTTRRSIISLLKHLVSSQDTARDEEKFSSQQNLEEVANLRDAARKGIEGASERADREYERAGREQDIVSIRKRIAVDHPSVASLLRRVFRQMLYPITTVQDCSPYLVALRRSCFVGFVDDEEKTLPPALFLRITRIPFERPSSTPDEDTSSSQHSTKANSFEDSSTIIAFVLEKIASLSQGDTASRGKLIQHAFLDASAQLFKDIASTNSSPWKLFIRDQVRDRACERLGVAIARILIHINPTVLSASSVRSVLAPLIQVGCKASHELFQFEVFMALTNLCALQESGTEAKLPIRETIYRGGIWKAARDCLLGDNPNLRRSAMQLWTNLITCPSSVQHFEEAPKTVESSNKNGSLDDRKLLLLFIQDVDDIGIQSAAAGAIAMLSASSPKAAALLATTPIPTQGQGSKGEQVNGFVLLRALVMHEDIDENRVKPAISYALAHIVKAVQQK